MKKNLKTKIGATLIGYLFLQTLTFCEPAKAVEPFFVTNDIVAAIRTLHTDVMQALQGDSKTNVINQMVTMNAQITKLFDESFKGEFVGKDFIGLSTLDKKIALYIKNFYGVFAKNDFSYLNFSEATKDKKSQTPLTFSDKSKENTSAVKKLLSQEIGYDTQTDPLKKNMDSKALLSQPIENESNNIGRAFLGLPPETEDKKPDRGKPSPLGSLDETAPAADMAPNASDLIGPDSYANEEQMKKAKLFMSYTLKSSPPPKTFYIPSKSEAKNDRVTIYPPYEPYTGIPVSTKTLAGEPSEYDQMLETLNQNAQYYQKYKMKTRAAIILRTIYLENLYRLYQERIKDVQNDKSQSIVEKEKAAALAGLSEKYYTDIKSKTTAEVNLEMLHAINKAVYFLYKLHEDNARMSLLISAGSLQMSLQDAQDERLYIKPIGALIENQCWRKENKSKQVCIDPATAAPGK